MPIRQEFDQLQDMVTPFLKKRIICGGLAIPLTAFSFFNLILILTTVSVNRENLFIVGGLALAGSIGMALFSELAHQNNQIHAKRMKYIQERITKSDQLPEHAKKRYLKAIHMNQTDAFHTFYQFLIHEERLKKLKREETNRD